MKVLLISPLPKVDPPCGDITYTETLLAHPPEGVQYETYAEALAHGTLQEHGTGRALKVACRSRQRLAEELRLTVVYKSVNGLRKRRWLFWEPYRFFSVKPGAYDLIHMHVFSARFRDLSCPLVVSNAAPQRFLYTQARAYSEGRTRALEIIEKRLGRALGMNVNSYSLPQATRLVVFTQFLKDWYVRNQIMPADKIDIAPIYLPSVPPRRLSAHPHRIGFVAKDFNAKGGATLLKAFERVRTSQPNTELWIVGCPPQSDEASLLALGIHWLAYTPRDVLMCEIFPSFDVFAYPTQFDGLPLVVLEAMANGIPIATSDYQAMPEIIGYGRAGMVSPVGNAEALAANILKLLEPSYNSQSCQASQGHFEAFYSATSVKPLLRASYEAAMA